MSEVLEFCTRVLGPGASAAFAGREAEAGGSGDRLEGLARAAAACRRRAEGGDAEAVPEVPDAPGSLAAAVGAELARAVAQLPERQREALALRDGTGITHAEIGKVMGLEASAVPLLLARARLGLRAARRGEGAGPRDRCTERERMLRLLVRRQDGEAHDGAEDDEVLRHLAQCSACRRAHAAMLEATACYRAWSVEPPRAAAGP